jgi:hypothetical protein
MLAGGEVVPVDVVVLEGVDVEVDVVLVVDIVEIIIEIPEI